MMTFALEREYIEAHPLLRFRMLPEERRALRVMTLEEERCLVESVASFDPTIGAYIAILGETGLRKSEGLSLKWSHIDSQRRILSVDRTKSGKPRYIPLSEYALEWLDSLVRVLGCPYVFGPAGGQATLERSPRAVLQGEGEGGPGVGQLSRPPALPGNPVGDAGGGSEDRPGAPGSQLHHHHHEVRSLRSSSCHPYCCGRTSSRSGRAG